MNRFGQRMIGVLIALLVALVPFVVMAAESYPPSFNHPNFQSLWESDDLPVLRNEVDRSWTWGPVVEDATGLTHEYYENAPGGQRAVQYFDKSRMEDNSYRAEGQWAVTNGLLVVEMVRGALQMGDAGFVGCSPAQIPVAGDPNQPGALTYAGLLAKGYNPGAYEWDPIFMPFLEANNGFYTVGLAATELLTEEVMVGGTLREVLIQAGERRVLTYTEGNPEPYVVEWGNVGQHYYNWRYGGGCDGVNPPPPVVETGQGLVLADKCASFSPIAGEEVCVVPGSNADSSITANTVTLTQRYAGETASALVIRNASGGSTAVQIQGSAYQTIWFGTDLSGTIVTADGYRADRDGRAVILLPEEGVIVVYLGTTGAQGARMVATFGQADQPGTQIDSSPYVWPSWPQ